MEPERRRPCDECDEHHDRGKGHAHTIGSGMPARRTVTDCYSAYAVKAVSEPEAAPAPAQIEFRSDVTVELVRSSAHDSDVLFAARVSTQGEQTLESAQDADLDASRSKGLINFLMRDRHGSPFEHNSMTFYVQAPIFVFREFSAAPHRVVQRGERSLPRAAPGVLRAGA